MELVSLGSLLALIGFRIDLSRMSIAFTNVPIGFQLV